MLIVNIRLYHNPEVVEFDDSSVNREVLYQLNYLKTRIDEGAADRMQRLFPEGAFFLHALYGLSWCEIGLRVSTSSPIYGDALLNAEWALQNFESDPAKSIFSDIRTSEYGAFYAGWSNYLRGKLLAVQVKTRLDTTLRNNFIQTCEEYANAINNSVSPFIRSYPSSTWPADGMTGIAALRIHDQLFEPAYDSLINDWVLQVKRKLDPQTGLIPHAVNSGTGEPIQGPRGSSQCLMIRLLAEIDENLAVSQYSIFKEKFVTSWLGLPAIREYPKGVDGTGDIDSGPVVWGIGAAASVVGIGTLNAVGDIETARALSQSIEALGMPITWAQQKYYAMGTLEIGDAFLVWALSTKPYISNEFGMVKSQAISSYWRLSFHLISLLGVTIVALPVLYAWRKKTQRRKSKMLP